MVKIDKKQIGAAEEVVCQHVQDPYARHEALVQLHRQVRLINRLGRANPWFKGDEPAVTFCIRGRLDIRLSRAVSEALGLGDL
jgi:hypothetical protein